MEERLIKEIIDKYSREKGKEKNKTVKDTQGKKGGAKKTEGIWKERETEERKKRQKQEKL